MNINRRKFFRVCAVGAAAASIPAFLRPEKIQGKIIPPSEDWVYNYPDEIRGLKTFRSELDNVSKNLMRDLIVPFKREAYSNELLDDIFVQKIEPRSNIEFPLDFLYPDIELMEYQKEVIKSLYAPEIINKSESYSPYHGTILSQRNLFYDMWRERSH